MDAEQLYQVCNLGIIPAWLLLVFAPKWKYTQLIVHSLFIPALLGVLYLWLILGDSTSDGLPDFSTLGSAMALFESPRAFLAGWVHYIAFDLFVGAWIVRDAQRSGLRHALVVPCLVFAFMFGPSGLLIYTALRYVTKKTILIN